MSLINLHSNAVPHRILFIAGEGAELANSLFLLVTAMVWTGGRWATEMFALSCNMEVKNNEGFRLLTSLWERLGFAIFTAWLIRLAVLPWPVWRAWDLLIPVAIVAGLLLPLWTRKVRKKVGKTDTSVIYNLFDSYGIFWIYLKQGSVLADNWVGHSLAELNLRKRNLLVLSITRAGTVIPFPKGSEVFQTGDELLVFGCTWELEQCFYEGKTGNDGGYVLTSEPGTHIISSKTWD